MPPPPPPPPRIPENINVFIIVIHALALSTTSLRLIHRKIIHRLGWDDLWASIAIICDLALFISFFTLNPANPAPNIPLARTAIWLTLLSYTVALWAARLSISVTITRILPAGRLNFFSKLASVAFCAFGVTLVIHKAYFCQKSQRGKGIFCKTPRYTGIMELVSDILADLWLLLGPVYMLFNMKLRRSHHRLLLGIFTSGILTSVASIAHGVFLFLRSKTWWIAVTGHLEVTIAILVSNSIVLVTVAYRAIKQLRRRIRENRMARSLSTETEQTDTDEGTITTPDREAARDTTQDSEEPQVDLTEISSDLVGGTFERRSVSYLSSAPFSSFSYSTNPHQSIPNAMLSSVDKSTTVPALRGSEAHAESGSLEEIKNRV